MIETIIRNFNVDRILYILKKRWVFILLFAIIGAALGGIYAEKKNINGYRASLSFIAYSRQELANEDDVYVPSGDFNYARTLMKTIGGVLKSDLVLKQVIENANLAENMTETLKVLKALKANISWAPVEDTTIFYVFVMDDDPYRALAIANAIAEVFPTAIAEVKTGGLSVLDSPVLPTAAIASVNFIKFVVLGGAVGFLLPFMPFMFFGLLDTTVRKTSELTSVFDIPVIGEVPMLRKGTRKKKVSKILNEETPFAVTESYNSLCTNLLYTTKGEKCPTYVVTSARQGEGKSLNSVNIAKTLANLGKKTLLIDADLRNATIGRYLDSEEEKGLSQYLAALKDEINTIKIDDHLDVLFAGQMPPNPAELIASPRFGQLIDICRKKYDFIIIDMPPVGVVSDALFIKDFVVGYLLVVYSNSTKLTEETKIIEKFEKTDANISGFVFNAVNYKANNGSYKYAYEYGYGEKNK